MSQSQLSQNSQTSQLNSGRRKKKNHLSQDDISDLESISQLLSERSNSRRKGVTNTTTSSKKSEPPKTNLKVEGSSVSEKKRLIQAQLEKAAKNPIKPSPNAVPTFQSQSKQVKFYHF